MPGPNGVNGAGWMAGGFALDGFALVGFALVGPGAGGGLVGNAFAETLTVGAGLIDGVRLLDPPIAGTARCSCRSARR